MKIFAVEVEHLVQKVGVDPTGARMAARCWLAGIGCVTDEIRSVEASLLIFGPNMCRS